MLKKTLVIIFSISCSTIPLNLHSMYQAAAKKKPSKPLESPQNVYDIIKKHYTFKKLTTKIQIILTEGHIKNRGGLPEVWQTILEKSFVTGTLHALDSTIIAQVNVTEASKKLKKHFKPQITSKTIRQIQSGKMTSPFKPISQPTIESRYLYTTLCSIALFSAGWIGKTLWDAGGKQHAIFAGSYIIKSLLDKLNL